MHCTYLTRLQHIKILENTYMRMYNYHMGKFEWDENKNRINIEKHAADFVDAIQIFEKPLLVFQDSRKEYSEKRYICVGHVNGRIMIVIYTERPKNIIRIISFRRANKREQKKFRAEFKNKLEAH